LQNEKEVTGTVVYRIYKYAFYNNINTERLKNEGKSTCSMCRQMYQLVAPSQIKPRPDTSRHKLSKDMQENLLQESS